jgi:hypothetical protein
MPPLKFYASSNYKGLHGLGTHDLEHGRPRGSAGGGAHVKMELLPGLSVLDRGVLGYP